MKYVANLVNDQGCIFDKTISNSIKDIKDWAKDRGGKYRLNIFWNFEELEEFKSFTVKNNKLYSIN